MVPVFVKFLGEKPRLTQSRVSHSDFTFSYMFTFLHAQSCNPWDFELDLQKTYYWPITSPICIHKTCMCSLFIDFWLMGLLAAFLLAQLLCIDFHRRWNILTYKNNRQHISSLIIDWMWVICDYNALIRLNQFKWRALFLKRHLGFKPWLRSHAVFLILNTVHTFNSAVVTVWLISQNAPWWASRCMGSWLR